MTKHEDDLDYSEQTDKGRKILPQTWYAIRPEYEP